MFGKRASFPVAFAQSCLLLVSEREKTALLQHGGALPIVLLDPL